MLERGDCPWCIKGDKPSPEGNHYDGNGKFVSMSTCLRGIAERQLRAFSWDVTNPALILQTNPAFVLHNKAYIILMYALRELEPELISWRQADADTQAEAMSYAIEAAHELHKLGLL